MNHSQVDLRIRRTKKLLRQAFIELLKEKPLDKITVNHLTQQAEINRATFYLHFKDMNDFVERFIDELFFNLENIFNQQYDVPFNKEIELVFLEQLCEYIAEHKQTFQSLLVSKSVPYFTQLFMEMIRQVIEKRNKDHLSPNHLFQDLEIEEDIAAWYVSSALIGTISMWLAEDLKYSPTYMAKQMMKLNPLRDLIN